MNAVLIETRTNLKCACQKKTLQKIGTATYDQSVNGK